jgi:hypothetical protein
LETKQTLEYIRRNCGFIAARKYLLDGIQTIIKG